MDGNKRTAFAAMYTFLAINEVDLTVDADATWTFVSRLYQSDGFRFEPLYDWLRRHTKQR